MALKRPRTGPPKPPRNLTPGPPTPDPVRQRPPADRFCDLILTGGIASGVVYPWAIVELARHYRFRSIGGNSVGAMAAALAAAAEYGRCCGNSEAFEPLRLSPLDLAEEDHAGNTRMLRLFQPDAGVRGLFDALIIGIRHFNAKQPDEGDDAADDNKKPRSMALPALLTIRDVFGRYWLGLLWLVGVLVMLLPALLLTQQAGVVAGTVLAITAVFVAADFVSVLSRSRWRILLGLLVFLGAVHFAAAVVVAWHLALPVVRDPFWTWDNLVPVLSAGAWLLLAVIASSLVLVGWTLLVVYVAVRRLTRELPAFRDNGFGLCSGRGQPASPGARVEDKALVEWLHEGIQRSAGREKEDRPLTFRDLWTAPRGMSLPAGEPSIELQTFSTNVTLGRPVIWPLRDRNTRLFFRKDEWARIFPPTVLDALWHASAPYTQLGKGDPEEQDVPCCIRELPDADMPIAVAARLSLSFPMLFSCVPVYAIDYEERGSKRQLRKCLLTDGGVCTNFPIHLFDAAHPKWPTFGLMLSRRIAPHAGQAIWLPDRHGEGRADNWSRGVPGAEREPPAPGPLRGVFGLLFGMLGTALRWNDNILSRLPHARNRVLRMALKSEEGQLHLTMSREIILRMAHEYGTRGGEELVRQFVSDTGEPTVHWREHLYVRAMNELRALTEHLRGYADAVGAAGFNKPLAKILDDAVRKKPLRGRSGWPSDILAKKLTPQESAALQEAVRAIADLSRVLEANERDFGPYRPVPPTELRIRSPI